VISSTMPNIGAGQRLSMTVQIGDRVEITQIRPQWGRRLQRMERVVRVERMRGRVVWTGPRFAVVELDCGYRESFTVRNEEDAHAIR